jgi:queuine/archaeosine tRNA-ribosyltransferase
MNRTTFIEHQNLHIDLPLFFPSISSVKTSFRPIDYLRLIEASKCPNFLISAYDIYNQDDLGKNEMIGTLNNMKKEGRLILLDSGNYESYWHKDGKWTIDKYNEILTNEFCSFCFSFDHQKIDDVSKDDLVKIAIKNTESNQNITNGTIAPIVHSKWEDLEYVCFNVVKNLNPKFIAVPERLLGSGIIARVQKLRQIRTSLNELGYYTPIHLLGTGNPFSLLLFAYAGADTFDGLEWCQTCIDENNFNVHHFQLRELFDHKTGTIKNYDIETLLNNISVYQSINKQIQTAFNNNEMMSFMEKYISKEVIKKLMQ